MGVNRRYSDGGRCLVRASPPGPRPPFPRGDPIAARDNFDAKCVFVLLAGSEAKIKLVGLTPTRARLGVDGVFPTILKWTCAMLVSSLTLASYYADGDATCEHGPTTDRSSPVRCLR